jgi:hypothetical protein
MTMVIEPGQVVGTEGDVAAMDRPTVVRDILHIVGGVKPSAGR